MFQYRSSAHNSKAPSVFSIKGIHFSGKHGTKKKAQKVVFFLALLEPLTLTQEGGWGESEVDIAKRLWGAVTEPPECCTFGCC